MDSATPFRHTGPETGWRRALMVRFVRKSGHRQGYSPSLREIAEGVGLATSTVSYHLSIFEQDGAVRHGARRPRTIVQSAVSGSRAGEVEVPLVGRSAGISTLTRCGVRRRTVSGCPAVASARTLFMLKVKGDAVAGLSLMVAWS